MGYDMFIQYLSNSLQSPHPDAPKEYNQPISTVMEKYKILAIMKASQQNV